MGMHMNLKIKILLLLIENLVQCSIDGISFLDNLNSRKVFNNIQENPCNPLYWYPKHIPEYCQYRKFPSSMKPDSVPKPMSIPVPLPTNPMIPTGIVAPMLPPPLIMPPLTFSTHLVAQNPLATVLGHQNVQGQYLNFQNPTFPIDYGTQGAAMVPGLPGIVSRDGGINILPFSDAYSELLEKHKQKLIRRKLQKILRRYKDYPSPRHFWRRKIFRDVSSE